MTQVPGLVATPGNGFVDLSWTAPPDEGSSITGYAIHWSTDNATFVSFTVGNVTSHRHAGLVNGITHFHAVAAINAAGTGPASAVVESTPRSAPSQVTGLVATPGNGTIQLSWDVPDDHGSPVTGYVVHVSTDGITFTPVDVGTNTTYLHEGLSDGATRHYRVHATSAMGSGANSSIMFATTWDVPGQVAGIETTRGNGQVLLEWMAPVDGGTPITGYVIRWTIDNSTYHEILVGNLTTHTHGGLTNGITYHYTVHAVNAMGNGAASPVASATPAAIPDPVGGLVATFGNASVLLSWEMPGDGGSPITGYVIRWTTDNSTYHDMTIGNITTYSHENLTNGLVYTYTVAAINDAGTGFHSAPASASPATVPGAPQDVVATPGHGWILVSWTAPDNDGGRPLGGYVIHRDGVLAGSVGSDTLAFNATGLGDGTTATFTVAAMNSVDEGPHSAPVSTTTWNVPGQVHGLVASTVVEGVALSWTAPPDGGTSITSFVMMRDGIVLATIDGSSTSWTDPAPVPGTNHAYRVVAANVVGQGEASAAVVVEVPDPLPAIIAAVAIVAGAAAVVVATLAWVRAGKPRVFPRKKP